MGALRDVAGGAWRVEVEKVQSSNNFSADSLNADGRSADGLSADGTAQLKALRMLHAEDRRKRYVPIVAVIVCIGMVVLGAGLVRKGVDGAAYANDAPPAQPAVVVLPPPAPVAAAAPSSASTAASGTLVRMTKKRLTVDGVLVKAPSAVLPCGAHTVKIGAGKAKMIDVPCGGEVSVKSALRTTS